MPGTASISRIPGDRALSCLALRLRSSFLFCTTGRSFVVSTVTVAPGHNSGGLQGRFLNYTGGGVNPILLHVKPWDLARHTPEPERACKLNSIAADSVVQPSSSILSCHCPRQRSNCCRDGRQIAHKPMATKPTSSLEPTEHIFSR